VSNSLAVATVTATLKNLLMSAFTTNAVDPLAGVSVTMVNPADRDAKTGANIFLYQISPNAQLRNLALPSRDERGATLTPPQAALDLHYLISFYGDPVVWEPQRLLGIAVRTLNTQPVLSPSMIAQTVASLATSTTSAFMAQSDLASSFEKVRLVEAEISLEEMSKLWSILLQAKYALSVLYVASVVLLDSPEPGVTALPVLQTNLSINPMRSVSLDQLVGTDPTTFGAIVSGAQVALLGTGLGDPGLTVVLDGNPLLGGGPSSSIVSRADNRLEFVLPSTLSAGAHGVQVASFASPGATLPIVESNPVTFLLRPQVTTVGKATVTQTAGGSFSGVLTVQVVPPAAEGQTISLLLNQKSPTLVGQAAPGLVLALDPNAFGSPPGSVNQITQLNFPFGGVDSGTFAVRLRVDGAESPPVLLPTSPPSMGPEVAIP
jgi:hypothetical protein